MQAFKSSTQDATQIHVFLFALYTSYERWEAESQWPSGRANGILNITLLIRILTNRKCWVGETLWSQLPFQRLRYQFLIGQGCQRSAVSITCLTTLPNGIRRVRESPQPTNRASACQRELNNCAIYSRSHVPSNLINSSVSKYQYQHYLSHDTAVKKFNNL